jgi:hypothetical protein
MCFKIIVRKQLLGCGRRVPEQLMLQNYCYKATPRLLENGSRATYVLGSLLESNSSVAEECASRLLVRKQLLVLGCHGEWFRSNSLESNSSVAGEWSQSNTCFKIIVTKQLLGCRSMVLV